jgi:hypothetical protein
VWVFHRIRDDLPLARCCRSATMLRAKLQAAQCEAAPNMRPSLKCCLMYPGSRSDLQCTIATPPRSHVVAYGVAGSPPLARRPVAWGAPSVAAYGLRRGTLALPLQKRDACSLIAHRFTFTFIPLCLTQLRNLQPTLSQPYNHCTSFTHLHTSRSSRNNASQERHSHHLCAPRRACW